MSNTAVTSPTRQHARGRISCCLAATVAAVIVWLVAHSVAAVLVPGFARTARKD
ncbi:hypothetical protein [Streptomyces sp. RTGN2]|uniref:hypothetical protein n=1 Tax=Streptomyces sp. RTGN2 TaxID=3016525 RepID=UPI002556DD48|nr:hypothetical protein [Streptomyces sp. RTGN2]